MRFVDSKISRDNRYALGTDLVTGEHYPSIPVANRMIDYDEYYKLSEIEFAHFSSNTAGAADFAAKCRRHDMDTRLIIPPGTDRGIG